jgi:hypothetical protein
MILYQYNAECDKLLREKGCGSVVAGEAERADRLVGFEEFGTMRELPALVPGPGDKKVAGGAIGFGEENGAGWGQVGEPEGVEVGPLGAVVEDVGAEDEIEFLGECVGLPIESADVGVVGKRVEAGEEEGRGFEVCESDVKTHSCCCCAG